MSHDPRDHDDLGVTRTDADETSQTRFGPRPVPEGHRRPAGPHESRHVPPSGDVSPDGSRAYPRPSRLAKWIVLGGTGIAAAALTAGSVYAARHLGDLISGNGTSKPQRRDRPRRHDGAAETRPRMQNPDADDRARMRRNEARDQRAPPPPRDYSPPKAAPRRNLMAEIEDNTATLTQSVDNVMRTLTAAVTGFRQVASQASAIVREFGDAAALVRQVIDPKAGGAPSAPLRPRPSHPAPKDPTAQAERHGHPAPDLRHDPLVHDPTDGPESVGPADHDPRTHRL